MVRQQKASGRLKPVTTIAASGRQASGSLERGGSGVGGWREVNVFRAEGTGGPPVVWATETGAASVLRAVALAAGGLAVFCARGFFVSTAAVPGVAD